MISALSRIQKSYFDDQSLQVQPETRMTFDLDSSRNVQVGLRFWADELGLAAWPCSQELRHNGEWVGVSWVVQVSNGIGPLLGEQYFGFAVGEVQESISSRLGELE